MARVWSPKLLEAEVPQDLRATWIDRFRTDEFEYQVLVERTWKDHAARVIPVSVPPECGSFRPRVGDRVMIFGGYNGLGRVDFERCSGTGVVSDGVSPAVIAALGEPHTDYLAAELQEALEAARGQAPGSGAAVQNFVWD